MERGELTAPDDSSGSRVRPSSGARLVGAAGRARKRLSRPPRGGEGPVWSRSMTVLALCGVVLVLLATRLDAPAASFAHDSGAAWIKWLARLTDIGESQWYLIPAGLIVLVLGLIDWGARGTRHQAWLYVVFGNAAFAFLAVALSGLVTNLFKMIFGRARPVRFDQNGPFSFDPFTLGYDFASFPSGHSTTAGAVTAVLMIWFPRAWPLILPAGMLVALTRIASRSHYPSDVVAGFLVGFLIAVVLARWLAVRRLLFRLRPSRMLPVLRRPARRA